MTAPHPRAAGSREPVLVLVTRDCPACEDARRVVAEIRQLCPGIRIDLVDVGSGEVPAGVPFVGTPTYVMAGRVISYGNPCPADLLTLIEGDRR